MKIHRIGTSGILFKDLDNVRKVQHNLDRAKVHTPCNSKFGEHGAERGI
jgi:hypothetical protein